MPTYERCSRSVNDLAYEILTEFESHKPLLDVKIKIDFVFASPDLDDDGQQVNEALKKNGRKALGIARKIPLKDRALGRGDVEVALDAPWWEEATVKQKAALLDHELHHFEPKQKDGAFVFDDLGRPIIQMRKHDFEFGWFKIIAERHGGNSPECIEARKIWDDAGQLFWPDLFRLEAA